MTFEEFKETHKGYLDDLFDDIWLCDEPIDAEEPKAVWHFRYRRGDEDIAEEDFEKAFGITFQDVADYANEIILKCNKKE